MTDDFNKDVFYQGTNKKAVLFLHGFMGQAYRMKTFYRYFQKKGFTVARPKMTGVGNSREDYLDFDPNKSLSIARDWVKKLSVDHDEVSVVGFSFGGNLALHLGNGTYPKIKSLVLLEMPVFFGFRQTVLLNTVQPLLSMLGVEFVKKRKLLYRAYYQKSINDYSFPYLPIKAIGKIKNYIKSNTMKYLPKITRPIFLINAEKSDLLHRKNAKKIMAMIGSKHKCQYIVPINNHDLNLLDDAGKMILAEKVYKFIDHPVEFCSE